MYCSHIFDLPPHVDRTHLGPHGSPQLKDNLDMTATVVCDSVAMRFVSSLGHDGFDGMQL